MVFSIDVVVVNVLFGVGVCDCCCLGCPATSAGHLPGISRSSASLSSASNQQSRSNWILRNFFFLSLRGGNLKPFSYQICIILRDLNQRHLFKYDSRLKT